VAILQGLGTCYQWWGWNLWYVHWIIFGSTI